MLSDLFKPLILLSRIRAVARSGAFRTRSVQPVSSTAVSSALALAAACALSAPVAAADLTVVVHNVQSGEGQVMLGLFDSASSFPKNVARGLQAAAAARDASGRVTLVVRNLSPGSYAVSAYHDLDANGRLNSNLLGLPSEPYGFPTTPGARWVRPAFRRRRSWCPNRG